jgi:hypothetical protein
LIGNHPLKLDCSEPGCTRCAAQIVNGELRFRVAHDGKRHEVHLPLDRLLQVLAATKAADSPALLAVSEISAVPV